MNNKFTVREIFNSQGMATMEVELKNESGVFLDSCPSGISTGKYEQPVVPTAQAIENIKKIIAPALEKEDLSNQGKIDKILAGLKAGVNAILPVSMACCRFGAAAKKMPFYRYLAELEGNSSPLFLPQPSFNMIEGGRHSDGGLAFQEFMIVPQKDTFEENLGTGSKIYQKLGEILGRGAKLSAEGAYAPPIKTASGAIDLILQASQGEDIKIAIDAAGAKGENYQELIEKYPIMSIEDPFDEDDYAAWASFKSGILIFGDDLTATNLERMKMAKEKDLCNAVIIKPNQIGTVTETLQAAKLARSFGWKIMVANRAAETPDDFIADLAVGIGADFIKSGAPFPLERMAKYNRLVKIETELFSGECF